jgi:hypothetical protein
VPNRPGGPSTAAEFEPGPLWPMLPAVRAGSVLRPRSPVHDGGTQVAAELRVRALVDATG